MAPILASRGGVSARAFGFFGAAAAPLGDYQAIMTATVDSGGASSITFSSIPSTYKHLQVRAIARSTAIYSQTLLKVNFNSDTGTNYAFHYLRGTGSAAQATSSVSNNHIRLDNFPEASQTASVYGAFVLDILDYTNTNKNKVTRALTGFDSNGDGVVALQSGLWMNTSAISTITIDGTYDAGVFAQYSSFALYGIKG